MQDTLLRHLHQASLEDIAALAGQKKRVLSVLTALSYHPDALIAWRAVEAFGRSAARVAQTDAEYVRNHLRRLFWLVNDESGGIAWRAPELIGETLFHTPRPFAEFTSPLVYLLDMESEDAPRFRPGILWAVARIAPHLAAGLLPAPPARGETQNLASLPWQTLLLSCLSAPDAQTTGLALHALSAIAYPAPLPNHAALLADPRPLEIYQDGHLHSTTIACLAAGFAPLDF